jgi:acetyl-CoA carboxylase biotin carboxyl carrier protein
VLEILKLFEQSKFDFLQLQEGERKITVSKGGFVPAGVDTALPLVRAAAPVAAPQAARPPAVPAPSPAAAKTEPAQVDPGLVPVTAPMVGKFYSAASPSDPPYVEVGTHVSAGTTVGLIEVMKVFASVKTEMAGTIEKILVTSGQFIEFGQTLFLMRPNGK